jgi:FMN phosphatase YigB (HAD superfamily)
MNAPDDVVFLLDVDNTLLDNDRFAADLGARLEQGFGSAGRDRYWALYAKLRDERGYVDYLATLQSFRAGLDDDPDLLQMSAFLLDYPFAQHLYPRALETIAHLGTLGVTVVLTDGDMVFQPRKVQRSGIWDAVAGRVLIYLHKQRTLEAMQRRYPARHYVMVDDKLRILAAMKAALGDRLTTVFPRQGHYALDPKNIAVYPPANITVERIGDLIHYDLPGLLRPALAGYTEKR